MNPDLERWNTKYRDAGPDAGAAPTPSGRLVEHLGRLPDAGRALDVACGRGGDAICLAAHGLDVSAVDGSIEALRLARAAAAERGLAVSFFCADLERYRPPPAQFDAIVCFRYLNRALLPALVEALAPGGVLLFETFNRTHLERRPRFNPDYVLVPGELIAAFAALEVLATNDGDAVEEPVTFLLGRR